MGEQKRAMKLASRGKRFGAALIDRVPLVLIGSVYSMVLLSLLASVIGNAMASYGFGSASDLPDPSRMAGTVWFFGVCLLIYTAVELVFYARSQSIGKAILGLQVVDSRDGTPIGFWKMLLREFLAKPAGESVFALGYIWILIDDFNRGWHDKILDTYVVDLRATEAWEMRMDRRARAEQTRTDLADGFSEYAGRQPKDSRIDVRPTDMPEGNFVRYTRTAEEIKEEIEAEARPEIPEFALEAFEAPSETEVQEGTEPLGTETEGSSEA